MLEGFPLYYQVSAVPNVNVFGAAKWPNIKFQGSEGVQGGGSSFASSQEIIYVYDCFALPYHCRP